MDNTEKINNLFNSVFDETLNDIVADDEDYKSVYAARVAFTEVAKKYGTSAIRDVRNYQTWIALIKQYGEKE